MWVGPYQDSDITSARVRWEDPRKAQEILSAIVAEMFRQSKPRDGVRIDLETNVSNLTGAIEQLQSFEKKLASASVPPSATAEAEDYTRSYVLVVNSLLEKRTQTIGLARQLEGLGPEHIIQPPHLPDTALRTGRAMTVILVAVITGFIVLCFVIARSAYRAAMRNASTAAKIMRIRETFRFRRNRSS